MNKIKASLLAVLCFTTTSLSMAVTSGQTVKTSVRDISCLATNIYHEARSEPISGQVAVAQVTMNRVKNKTQFANTVCGVVFEHAQFSWTLGKPKGVTDQKAWNTAVQVARVVLTQSHPLPKFNALFYHTTKIKPRWAKHKRVLTVIGNHVFYS